MADDDFRNRTDWLALALAMTIWAAHFALVWSASSIFPGHPAARWIGLILGVLALSALARLWYSRNVQSLHSASGLGIALAAGGVVYDTLPAILG
jgi:hypothetical protein